jgi:hypothetical protein
VCALVLGRKRAWRCSSGCFQAQSRKAGGAAALQALAIAVFAQFDSLSVLSRPYFVGAWLGGRGGLGCRVLARGRSRVGEYLRDVLGVRKHDHVTERVRADREHVPVAAACVAHEPLGARGPQHRLQRPRQARARRHPVERRAIPDRTLHSSGQNLGRHLPDPRVIQVPINLYVRAIPRPGLAGGAARLMTRAR